MKAVWKVVFGLGVLFVFVLLAGFIWALASVIDADGLFEEHVALIPIHGSITFSDCSATVFDPVRCSDVATVKQMLAKADGDDSVKAILLSINSGGGAVVASRELTRAISATDKPVVAWIGEIGASGAYYAASAADEVIADEDSMTGSLGAVMYIQHYYDLFNLIGVNMTVIKSGEKKDIGSPYRPTTSEEEAQLQELIKEVHEDFIADVAANRGLSIEEVRNISDGSIYLGSKAKELGLIDEVGGFEYARMRAGELGGIEGVPSLKEYEVPPTMLDLLAHLSTWAGYGFGHSFQAGVGQSKAFLY